MKFFKLRRTAPRILFKQSAEVKRVVISYSEGNLRDGQIGGKQKRFGPVHADPDQKGMRGASGVFLKFVYEIIGTHPA